MMIDWHRVVESLDRQSGVLVTQSLDAPPGTSAEIRRNLQTQATLLKALADALRAGLD
jgi:hypothetical protein